MSNITTKITAARSGQSLSPASYLAGEYQRWQHLFDDQSALIQRFFEVQARSLADALLQPASQARFSLPDRIIPESSSVKETPIPAEQREQLVGGFLDRLTRTGLGAALRQRLDELEASPSPAVAAAAGLLRFATAIVIVRDRLPSGRSVRCRALEGERGELLVSYVPAAHRFFLPQCLAFDEQDRLLVNSAAKAEAYLASMQGYLRALDTAVSLAPYVVADPNYQQKRYGMVGKLINQGRALARFETCEIIATIQRRAEANNLNRGLSLSLPYFDDQNLEMKQRDFNIIPAGRVMFIPAFVVLAARKELIKVEQDTRLNCSTRNHLLSELRMLETAFQPAGE